MIKEFHVDSLQAFISGKLIKLSSSFREKKSPNITQEKKIITLWVSDSILAERQNIIYARYTSQHRRRTHKVYQIQAKT